jgi:hypothetical protein
MQDTTETRSSKIIEKASIHINFYNTFERENPSDGARFLYNLVGVCKIKNSMDNLGV